MKDGDWFHILCIIVYVVGLFVFVAWIGWWSGRIRAKYGRAPRWSDLAFWRKDRGGS